MNDSEAMEGVLDEHDSAFGGINQLAKELHNLDERGLILSLAAFAEDTLGTLLKAFLLQNNATKQLLEGFNAPLGTFSSRIKATYALGLITKEQYDDLEHLRKIRNDFSHTWRPITFADESIAAHIKEINYSNIVDEYPETPLEKVRTALSSLLIELQVTADQIKRKGRRVEVTGRALTKGFSGNFDEQVEGARSEAEWIKKELLSATGERRSFFIFALQRWVGRLIILESSSPIERRAEVAALRDDFLLKIMARPENRDLLQR